MPNLTVRNDVLTVGTSTTAVAPERDRHAIVFTNRSTAGQVVTIHMGYGAAVANEGVVLAQGEKYAEADDPAFQCYRGPIVAIASAAGATLSVMER